MLIPGPTFLPIKSPSCAPKTAASGPKRIPAIPAPKAEPIPPPIFLALSVGFLALMAPIISNPTCTALIPMEIFPIIEPPSELNLLLIELLPAFDSMPLAKFSPDCSPISLAAF